MLTNATYSTKRTTTETINQRQLRMRNNLFSKITKNKKNKNIYIYSLIETGRSGRFSRYMVVVFVPQSFMRRCSRRSHNANNESLHMCFEKIDVAFLQTNAFTFKQPTFTYY